MANSRAVPTQRLVSLSQSLRDRLGASPGAPQIEDIAWGFLQQGAGQERFFWRDSQSGSFWAGFGAAAQLKAWGSGRFRSIQRQARALFAGAWIGDPAGTAAHPGRPRLFGGFAFRDDFVPDHTWAAFHPAHFILPHFQLAQQAGQSWLTINALIPAEDDPFLILPDLAQALAQRAASLGWDGTSRSEEASISPAGWMHGVFPAVCPEPVEVRYPMSPAAWEQMICSAVRCIREGAFQKVVLARECEVRCGGPMNVDIALRFLDAHYPGCYRFLFEPRPGHAFFGATPELLVELDGMTLRTMGLAGSARRGRTPAEDDVLAQQLLENAKDRQEHQLVVTELRRRLARRTHLVSVPTQPQVLRLSNIQHLYTPLEARLRSPAPGASPADDLKRGVLPFLERLHPTPALGGSPRPLAMEYIRQAEPVPRGWYAAPVGWLDASLDGAFAVAIRSAVVQEERAWLYAGAGIVAASEPDQEWKETELKFRPILQALGLEK